MATNGKPPLRGSSAFIEFERLFKDHLLPNESLSWQKIIGKGAFAVVSKCSLEIAQEDGSTKSVPVAVKQLRPEVFREEDHDVKTFFGETQLLRKLKHPSIVSFIGVVSHKDNNQCSIGVVQEYMNQGSLNALLVKQCKSRRKELYQERDGLRWMLQIARGLEYLHKLKDGSVAVIHRDLKPHNILLHEEEGGEVVAKLADFGLSALVRKQRLSFMGKHSNGPMLTDSTEVLGSWGVDDSSRSSAGRQKSLSTRVSLLTSNLVTRFSVVSDLFRSSSSSTPTKMGNVKSTLREDTLHNLSGRTGSLMYMPPEVIRGEKYNESADVFSFIMVLFEVLNKYKNIYRCTKPGGNACQDVERWAVAVSNGYRPELNEDWPAELKNLIMDGWSANAMHRPSMSDVVRELESLLEKGAFLEPPPFPEHHIQGIEVKGKRHRLCCF
ncbi:hypothetical protein BSKO_07303 [Bryopsis sp. KO-2023]|nr:hypothetical protein BSKO_07303 [Bryopsis sp. KO-2023]